ncbi:hypothetical protein SEA_ROSAASANTEWAA_35 [Streptomyces phage RosaAsantewaa]|nr:hypothetical protein SEA_ROSAASANTEWAA_35 [Streptomyces phage RosaAsantewaa]
MFKFLTGVLVGALFRDALVQAYKRSKFPHQDRIEAAYYILRNGTR